jgi:hypothetical protein
LAGPAGERKLCFIQKQGSGVVCKSQYKIDELAGLVHPRDGHQKVFALIEAYLDESGIHNGAAVCIVAGYFGTKGALRGLEKSWNITLGAYRFALRDFHAKNLVDRGHHHSMLVSLTNAIGKHRKVYPVSWGIVIDDFNSLSLEHRRFITGATLNPKSKKLISTGCPSKPYFVPFQNVVKIVTNATPPLAKAHFFVGVDRPFYEYATTLFQQFKVPLPGTRPWNTWKGRDKLGVLSAPLASETPQLQAADLLAYLTYRHMVEWNAHGKVAQPSELLSACLKNSRGNFDHQYSCKESMSSIIKEARKVFGNWDDENLSTVA